MLNIHWAWRRGFSDAYNGRQYNVPRNSEIEPGEDGPTCRIEYMHGWDYYHKQKRELSQKLLPFVITVSMEHENSIVL